MGEGWVIFADIRVWQWLGGGLILTVLSSLLILTLGFIFGVVFALLRRSKNPFLSAPATLYIEVIRGTPSFLILMFIYFGAPTFGIRLLPFVSVVIALVIYATALLAEIVRAGLAAVPRGQIEAAQALGLKRWAIFRLIQFPQAMAIALPGLVGQLVVIAKHTAVGSVVGMDELMHRAVIIYNGYQNPFEVLLIVALIYCVMLYFISLSGQKLEMRLKRQPTAS